MQIPNIFKKKDEESNLPPQDKQSVKHKIAPSPIRDKKGRFVGKKTEEPKKKEEKPQVISVTFFGKQVRKLYFQDKWYFNINDIYQLSTPKAEGQEVTVSEEYQKIKKAVSHKFEDEEYTTAEGAKKLVEQINGIFPGPLTRWLDESANMEYMPAPEVKPKAEE